MSSTRTQSQLSTAIYSILPYLHLVSLKCVVIVLMIITTLTSITAVVNKTLYYYQIECRCCCRGM